MHRPLARRGRLATEVAQESQPLVTPASLQVGSSSWTRRPWHRGQAWRGAVTGARDGEPLRVEAGRISEHPPPKTA